MSVLKIHLTYQCTAECAHCRFRCTRAPAPVLDSELALRCIRELAERNDLKLVVLLGGEPGLYPQQMMALLRAAHELGLATRLETNGFWARDDAAAERFLAPLAELGTSVSLSLDAFHRPYVPPERVARAVLVAERLGAPHCLETAYVDHPAHNNPWDAETDALCLQLYERVGHPIAQHWRGSTFFVGRSTDALAPMQAAGRGLPQEPCRAVPWWHDGELDTLDLLILDPQGYLSKGCGIAIADLKRQPLAQVLAGYDPAAHPILGPLLTGGPLALARQAQAQTGFQLKADYADRCHLCQEARQALRAVYPEYLVPAQHYR